MLRTLGYGRTPEPPRLSDIEWALIEPILMVPVGRGGRPPKNRRRDLEAIRWVAWTGRPWSQLPAEFGNPESVRRYYARLKRSGILTMLLSAFPKTSYKDDPETVARLGARALLEVLRHLDERLARGPRAER